MARIEQPFAEQAGLSPNEVGAEAFAAAGRRLGGFGSQEQESLTRTGQVFARSGEQFADAGLAQYEHQEISHGAATFAALSDSLIDDWNNRLKANPDPNNQSIAGQFREDAETKLNKFQEAFNTEAGQKFAEARVEALRTHLDNVTRVDMATRAGQAARVNANQSVNTLSNMALKDPSSLDFALKSFDTSVNGIIGSSPNLKGPQSDAVRMEISEKGREQIVKSAAFGYIQKTGQVPPWASDPAYSKYISGIELKQLQTNAQVTQRTNLLLQKQTEVYQRQLDDQAVHAASNKAFNDNVTIDPVTNRPVIGPNYFRDTLSIAHNNPNAPNAASTVRTMLDWGEKQQNPKPIQTDPIRKQALVDGLWSADKPTTVIDIYKAEVDGELSRQDAAPLLELTKQLQEEPLRGPIWRDTMEAVKERMMISLPNMPKDTVGMGNYAKFAQTFIPQYIAAKRAGTLAPNALDVNDPKSMISQAMAPFKRTAQDRIRDYTQMFGGDVNKAVETTPQLPPAAERRAGQTYQTAMGMMKWTGTGWVKP